MSSPAQSGPTRPEITHPSWCDPRYCDPGVHHVGTPITFLVEHGDVELSLARHRYFGDTPEVDDCLLTVRQLQVERDEVVLTRSDFIKLNRAHFMLDGLDRAAELSG
jgi:hypothetical protein